MTEQERKLYDLRIKLERLNTHINSLREWNGYAEDQQREYDYLLLDYNRQLNLVKKEQS